MGYQGSDIPNQDQAGAGEHLLGYGYSVDGIPLEGGDMPLDPKTSATPNREDADFNVKGDLEGDYAEDYFDAEEERLGDPLADRRVVGRETEQWSEGIADEANRELADLDRDFPDDAALPEMGMIELIEEPTPEQLDPTTSDRYITEE